MGGERKHYNLTYKLITNSRDTEGGKHILFFWSFPGKGLSCHTKSPETGVWLLLLSLALLSFSYLLTLSVKDP